MTAENTEPATQDADSTQRNRYMAALSLAETLISQTATLPTSFTVRASAWTDDAPELRFYFHRDVPGMRQFRDDQMLTETMETRADGSVHCEATRDMDGVRVNAWTLSDPPTDDAEQRTADAEQVTA
ncbi:hypothetical protein [Streptomyces sp. NPDC057302]|uniref:hypothetical protein n=1 Tax=Streptomyces sp. NPDC057302 TaxID=3346094 RepID=UPI0036387547